MSKGFTLAHVIIRESFKFKHIRVYEVTNSVYANATQTKLKPLLARCKFTNTVYHQCAVTLCIL